MFVLRCPEEDCGFPVSGPQPRLLGLARKIMRLHVMAKHHRTDTEIMQRVKHEEWP